MLIARFTTKQLLLMYLTIDHLIFVYFNLVPDYDVINDYYWDDCVPIFM